MSNVKALSALAIVLFSAPVAGEQALVRFTGGVQSVACPEVCGACCGDALVEEVNGGFRAHVAESDYPLTGLVDDGRYYRLSGFFFQGAGACGAGDCTYFHLDALDAANNELEPMFDSETRSMHMPSLLVDNQERWRVDLKAPYHIGQAEFLETVKLVTGRRLRGTGRGMYGGLDMCRLFRHCRSRRPIVPDLRDPLRQRHGLSHQPAVRGRCGWAGTGVPGFLRKPDPVRLI